MIGTLHKIFDQVEEDEVGGTCSACGGKEKRIHGFGGET